MFNLASRQDFWLRYLFSGIGQASQKKRLTRKQTQIQQINKRKRRFKIER
jgi:hypothetical protein